LLATLWRPAIVWVAAGGSTGLTHEKTQSLAGRRVLVCFDADAAGQRGTEAALLRLNQAGAQAAPFRLSQALRPGYDIADYLADNPHLLKGDTNSEIPF